MRFGLQNDVILIQLRVHGVDLPLSEGVVQSVIYGRGRDSQPRCRRTIKLQRNRQSAGLLVGRNIFELMKHLVKDGAVVIDPADEITGAMILKAPA